MFFVYNSIRCGDAFLFIINYYIILFKKQEQKNTQRNAIGTKESQKTQEKFFSPEFFF